MDAPGDQYLGGRGFIDAPRIHKEPCRLFGVCAPVASCPTFAGVLAIVSTVFMNSQHTVLLASNKDAKKSLGKFAQRVLLRLDRGASLRPQGACERHAQATTDGKLQTAYGKLCDSWIRVGNNAEFAEM